MNCPDDIYKTRGSKLCASMAHDIPSFSSKIHKAETLNLIKILVTPEIELKSFNISYTYNYTHFRTGRLRLKPRFMHR